MLINRKNILSRFSRNLEWASGIDLATAWATPNGGLRSLWDRAQSRRLRVRAVVGLRGSVTKPEALRTLADLGELRSADESQPFFHPKVYIFRRGSRSVAWIGSANFTFRGFGGNEEALFETSNTETVEDWFGQLWDQCSPLDECAINDYANSTERNRPEFPTSSVRPPVMIDSARLSLLTGANNWRNYVVALEQCDRWWGWWNQGRANHHSWSVLGETCSWSQMIQDLHEVIKREDWLTLDDRDKKRLLGQEGGSWALLGSTRPKALKTVFGARREQIQETVRRAVAIEDADFPNEAVKAYEALVKIKWIREGTASRLLALARPDRFVSLNGASKNQLGKLFGFEKVETLWRPSNYGRLLEEIYDQPWFREPAPQDAREETICWMRAALLDSFVYEPA